MTLRFARVSEVATQVRGVSYSKDDASSVSRLGYLPVFRAGNITDHGLVFSDLVYVPAERIAERQGVRRHDIVIAASSGSLEVVGKAASALTDFEGGFGAFCKVLRPGPDVDPAYFAQCFKTQSYRRRVSALATGININNLRMSISMRAAAPAAATPAAPNRRHPRPRGRAARQAPRRPRAARHAGAVDLHRHVRRLSNQSEAVAHGDHGRCSQREGIKYDDLSEDDKEQ